MINVLQKIKTIYSELNETSMEASQLEGFSDIDLLEYISVKNENKIPTNSFDEFLRYIYINSGLDYRKVPYFEKLNPIVLSNRENIVIFKKPAQLGATTYFTCLFAYYFIKFRMPMLYVSVDENKISIIKNNLSIFLKNLGIDILIKEHEFLLTNIGIIYFAYSTSAKTFRSKPAAYVFIDEAAAMPTNIGGEGDVISLALARTTTYSNMRKIFVFSAPTVDNTFFENYYYKGERFFVFQNKCSVCGTFFEPAVNDIANDNNFKCPKCLNNINWIQSCNDGEWREVKKENNLRKITTFLRIHQRRKKFSTKTMENMLILKK